MYQNLMLLCIFGIRLLKLSTSMVVNCVVSIITRLSLIFYYPFSLNINFTGWFTRIILISQDDLRIQLFKCTSKHKNSHLTMILNKHEKVMKRSNITFAQTPQCTSPVSHNASFCNRKVHIPCAHFCYKMERYGIFNQCQLRKIARHNFNMSAQTWNVNHKETTINTCKTKSVMMCVIKWNVYTSQCFLWIHLYGNVMCLIQSKVYNSQCFIWFDLILYYSQCLITDSVCMSMLPIATAWKCWPCLSQTNSLEIMSIRHWSHAGHTPFNKIRDSSTGTLSEDCDISYGCTIYLLLNNIYIFKYCMMSSLLLVLMYSVLLCVVV